MELEFLHKYRLKPYNEKDLVHIVNQHNLNCIWDYAFMIHSSFILAQSPDLSDSPSMKK